MAELAQYTVEITFQDGVLRQSVWQVYVSPTNAKAYVAAADTAARAATNVGQLITAASAMSEGVPVIWAVKAAFNQEEGEPIPDNVLRNNKIVMHMRSAGRGLVLSVPARNPASFLQKENSIELVLDDPTEMDTFVTALNTWVVDQFGNSVAVQSANLND
jgi:hypothetical protein